MLGLEDLAHATGADLVEDRVVAQDQRFGFAPAYVLGLELGQMVLLDQFRDEFFSVFGMCLRRYEVFELAPSNDARFGQLLDDGFEVGGHGRIFRTAESELRL